MRPSSVLKNVFTLLASLAVVFAAAGIGSVAVNMTLRSWYTLVQKPAWNPPDWVFGPVWTLLYIMMAVSAWLVLRERPVDRGRAHRALAWFALQLVLNAAWSWFFFAWRQPGWAFVEILALWLAIVMTALASWRVNRVAAYLLVPYLAWVTFAATLNGSIWALTSK